MKQLKGIDGKLDKEWSAAVKRRDNNKCRVCHKTRYLNSHHIYSRSKRSTRWNVSNGITLCVGCHTFSSRFSAHKTPLEFLEWLLNDVGQDYIDRLRIKANSHSHLHQFEKEIVLKELKNYMI